MKLLLFLFLAGCVRIADAQEKPGKDYRAELEVTGRCHEFSVTPAGQMWIATSTGNVYRAESIFENWTFTTLQAAPGKPNLNNHFERAVFFNKDTGLLSGWVGDAGAMNIILRTTDGGKSWNKIKFIENGDHWMDASFHNNTGEVWMGGGSGYIFYSNDYGATWSSFKKYGQEPDRPSTIYFSHTNDGIIGTFRNLIYTTTDNCRSWKAIPTPLDQHKYPEPDTRPEISKVAVFNDYYLAQQHGYCFYTRRDVINWKLLPGAADFAAEPSNDTLFVVANDLKVHTYKKEGSTLQRTGQFKRPLSSLPKSIKISSGKLFAWMGNEIAMMCDTLEYETPLYTGEKNIEAPENFSTAHRITWAVRGKDVIMHSTEESGWFRFCRLPFYAGQIKALTDTSALVIDAGGEKFYILNAPAKSLRPCNNEHPLRIFNQYNVVQVTIENGSAGCFHYQNHAIVYNRNGDEFSVTNNEMISGTEQSSGTAFRHSIPVKEVSALVNRLNDSSSAPVNLRAFNIAKEDVNEYRKEIDRLEKSRNSRKNYRPELFGIPFKHVDFSFFRRVPDTLRKLDDAFLYSVLSKPTLYQSTTTNWTRIILENAAGRKICVYHNYHHSTPWFIPWIIQTEDYSFAVYDVEITKFISRNAPRKFLPGASAFNKQLLFTIATELYKKHVQSLVSLSGRDFRFTDEPE